MPHAPDVLLVLHFLFCSRDHGFESSIQERKTNCLLSIRKLLACARTSKLTTTNMYVWIDGSMHAWMYVCRYIGFIYQPAVPCMSCLSLRSYTLPVTFWVPQKPTCQHEPVSQASNMQLAVPTHHRLHADNDCDAVTGPSVWRSIEHIPFHLFKENESQLSHTLMCRTVTCQQRISSSRWLLNSAWTMEWVIGTDF